MRLRRISAVVYCIATLAFVVGTVFAFVLPL
jgi:hypothetical protein